jgi:hypothetical protein
VKEERLRILFRFVLLSALVAAGCQAPLSAPAVLPPAAAVSPAALPAVAVGRTYEFTLKSPTPGVTETYRGVVKEFDDATIVIAEGARTVRREAEPLPPGPLGLGRKRFRNAGVGREALPGDVTVRREDLVSIAPLEPADPNAALRAPAREPSAAGSEPGGAR